MDRDALVRRAIIVRSGRVSCPGHRRPEVWLAAGLVGVWNGGRILGRALDLDARLRRFVLFLRTILRRAGSAVARVGSSSTVGIGGVVSISWASDERRAKTYTGPELRFQLRWL